MFLHSSACSVLHLCRFFFYGSLKESYYSAGTLSLYQWDGRAHIRSIMKIHHCGISYYCSQTNTRLRDYLPGFNVVKKHMCVSWKVCVVCLLVCGYMCLLKSHMVKWKNTGSVCTVSVKMMKDGCKSNKAEQTRLSMANVWCDPPWFKSWSVFENPSSYIIYDITIFVTVSTKCLSFGFLGMFSSLMPWAF